MPGTKSAALSGKVIAFNISPKGHYESVLLDVDRRTVQVNFSPEEAAFVADGLKEGSEADILAEPEGGKKPSDHPVYRLISFDASGKARDEPRPHDIKVSGKVVRLNYAKHGEVNGAILDNGCFVHLKPEGAKEARLEVGQVVKVKGEEKPLPTHRVVEVYEIDQKAIRAKKPS